MGCDSNRIIVSETIRSSRAITTTSTTEHNTSSNINNEGLVVAEGILADDVEEEVRRKVMLEAEEAEIVDYSKIRRNIIICILILFSVIVTLLVLALVLEQQHNNDSNKMNSKLLFDTLVAESESIVVYTDGCNDKENINKIGLHDPNSPQYKAYQFLAATLESVPTDTKGKNDLLEGYALETLYFATNRKLTWDDWSQYLQPPSHCSWDTEGGHCFGGNPVIHLDLSNRDLDGTLPNEIGFLSNMVSFNVSGNFLEGRIPNVDLHSIKTLDFSNNQFEYTVPSIWSRYDKLESISIQNSGIDTTCGDIFGTTTNDASINCCDDDSSNCTIS
jgi:hypothetical protein